MRKVEDMPVAAFKIGLLGMGTVGGGTVTVLTRNAREIERRAGRGIRIAHAAARQYNPDAITGLDQIGCITDDEQPFPESARRRLERDSTVADIHVCRCNPALGFKLLQPLPEVFPGLSAGQQPGPRL